MGLNCDNSAGLVTRRLTIKAANPAFFVAGAIALLCNTCYNVVKLTNYTGVLPMAEYKVIRVKPDVRTRFNRFSAWVQDRTGNKTTDNEAVSSLLDIADLVRKEEANIAAGAKEAKP